MRVPRAGERSRSRRAPALGWVGGALVAVGVVGLLVGASARVGEAAPPTQQEPPRTGGPYWAGRYGCVACHGGQGQGTPIGPPLVGRPDSPLSYELYLRQMRTPLLLMPDYPASVLSDEQIAAIWQYFNQQEPAR